jgi:hypothetical protein
MDSYGNSGFKGVGRRIETSSLRSNNVRTQKINVSGTSQLSDVTVSDGLTVEGDTVLHNNLNVHGNTRLGNTSGDSVGFYTTNGTSQQTTGVASATVVNGAAGDAIIVTTFDGYTVAQVVRSLRNVGLLA